MPRAAPRVILYLMIAFHAALILLSAIPIQACSCLDTPPMAPCQAMAKVQTAFTGRVLTVDRIDNDLRARIRIDEAFRGISGTEVDVYTSNSSCGLPFEVGKAFFIEARRGATGRLFTGGCGSYATSLPYATPYIDALRALANPDSPVQIFGFATADLVSIRMQYGNAIPTPGIRLQLRSGGQLWETTTDAKGNYAFTSVPSGEFQLTADIAGVPEPHKQRTFQLKPGQCSSENFLTVPFAAIAGTLRDAGGNPVPNQFVSISAIPPTVDPHFPFIRATSAAGEFRFDLLPMGSYTLSINADRPPNQRDWYGNRNPYPRALHPVTLKNGESAENIEFRLPAIPATKTIQGRVTDPDGKPSPALVTLLDPRYPSDKAQVDSVETNEAGAFAVIIQEGRSYLLFAQSQSANLILHSDFIELPPNTLSPLHLSLTHNAQYNQCTACRRYEIWVSPLWKNSTPK